MAYDPYLGGQIAPRGAAYIVKTPNGDLTAEQALSALATGILKSTTGTGLISIAAGSDLPSHVHAEADVTGLVSDLAGKAAVFTGYTGSLVIPAVATLTITNGIITAIV